jgi:putative membrane-bound dehydrogenase-like protein
MLSIVRRLTLLIVFAASVSTLVYAQKPAKTKPTPESETFGKNLPRIPPKSPAESMRSIRMRKGFKVELVASEPLLRDPAAVDFDERGRMYVAELPPYNSYVVKDFKVKSSVRLLEDTDGDGKFDKSTLFADGLNYATAVACWKGGLFVGDAPHLYYMKDVNGDGKADTKKIIFTGFGSDTAGEAHLNSIRWGFDNRFHFSTNLSGGDVKAVADKKAKPVSVRGRGFIFDPNDLSKFELTSGGGQHGMSMDNWGRKFVCSNSVPAQMLMYDDRYVARNPYLQAPAAAVDVAPGGKFTKLFRISPPEPWRVLRTRLRREGKFRGSDEGGKPFGFFTGATGITIYRGDAWPEEYRGNLIVGDVANNLVYRARLEADGVGLIARRADAGKEFLASTDNWFRPVQFANAPDGSLYVLDMYRGLIEGAAFLPPEFTKHINAVEGYDRGRVFRIVPQNYKQTNLPDFANASTTELVAYLEHNNGWHRDTASRLLYERQDRSAVSSLKKLVATSKLPEGRMTALYSLDGLVGLDDATLLAALNDSSADVRIQAMRLAEQRSKESPAIRASLLKMVDDSYLLIRYQLAYTLGSFQGTTRNKALAGLALRDSKDRWLELAVLSSLGDGAGDVFAILAQNSQYRKTAHGRKFLVTLSRQIGFANRTNEVASVVKALNQIPEQERSLSEALVQALVEKQKGKTREQLLAAAGGKAKEVLAGLLKSSIAQAADEKLKTDQRVQAVRSLGLASFDDVKKLFAKLLELSQPLPVQGAALQSLAGFENPGVAELLLEAWPGLSPQLRSHAAETLLSRPVWVTQFFDAIEQKQVARGDVDPARLNLLKQHPDKSIAARAKKLFADTGLGKRKEVVEKYQAALNLKSDSARGKAVFKKNCSACHKLEGIGTSVGADLKGIRERGLASVMLNILDPNREVKPKYLNYILVTDEGVVLTGMIVSENANTITIQRPDSTKSIVQRIQIEHLRSTGMSFMPEGLEKQVDVQGMADLLRYLDSIR